RSRLRLGLAALHHLVRRRRVDGISAAHIGRGRGPARRPLRHGLRRQRRDSHARADARRGDLRRGRRRRSTGRPARASPAPLAPRGAGGRRRECDVVVVATGWRDGANRGVRRLDRGPRTRTDDVVEGSGPMTETIVLIHGSATGSASWDRVARPLVSSGATVVAPGLLGYGGVTRPISRSGISEEGAHLVWQLGLRPCSCRGTVYAVGHIGTFHLVAHSLGAWIALHLRRALGARVTRMTLVDPLVVSVLRERGEDVASAEMEEDYQRF